MMHFTHVLTQTNRFRPQTGFRNGKLTIIYLDLHAKRFLDEAETRNWVQKDS